MEYVWVVLLLRIIEIAVREIINNRNRIVVSEYEDVNEDQNQQGLIRHPAEHALRWE
jgi:hypothetical protein